MDDGLQQTFVAEHDSSAATVADTLGCEPLADVAGLDVFCGGTDIGELLWGLFSGVLDNDCTASILKTSDERLLHLMQEVEAHEDISVVVGR